MMLSLSHVHRNYIAYSVYLKYSFYILEILDSLIKIKIASRCSNFFRRQLTFSRNAINLILICRLVNILFRYHWKKEGGQSFFDLHQKEKDSFKGDLWVTMVLIIITVLIILMHFFYYIISEGSYFCIKVASFVKIPCSNLAHVNESNDTLTANRIGMIQCICLNLRVFQKFPICIVFRIMRSILTLNP